LIVFEYEKRLTNTSNTTQALKLEPSRTTNEEANRQAQLFIERYLKTRQIRTTAVIQQTFQTYYNRRRENQPTTAAILQLKTDLVTAKYRDSAVNRIIRHIEEDATIFTAQRKSYLSSHITTRYPVKITELEEFNLDEELDQNIIYHSSYYTVPEEEQPRLTEDFAQTVILNNLETEGSAYSHSENPGNYSDQEEEKLELDTQTNPWNPQIGLASSSQTKGKLPAYSQLTSPQLPPLNNWNDYLELETQYQDLHQDYPLQSPAHSPTLRPITPEGIDYPFPTNQIDNMNNNQLQALLQGLTTALGELPQALQDARPDAQLCETNLVKVDQFSEGAQDPISWFKDFEKATRANGINDVRRLTIVPAYLKEAASV